MDTVALASIRVMIVDDNAAVREGLESILGANADMTVVATAVNGEQAVDGVARQFNQHRIQFDYIYGMLVIT